MACGITDDDRAAGDGRLGRLYKLLDISRAAMRRAEHRLDTAEAIALLDPSRKLRIDALQGDELRKVLSVCETLVNLRGSSNWHRHILYYALLRLNFLAGAADSLEELLQRDCQN